MKPAWRGGRPRGYDRHQGQSRCGRASSPACRPSRRRRRRPGIPVLRAWSGGTAPASASGGCRPAGPDPASSQHEARCDAARRVGLPLGVMTGPAHFWAHFRRVLVRASCPAEEVTRPRGWRPPTQGARTISHAFSAHTPGVNAGSAVEPARHAFSVWSCYEARPGVPMTTLAGIRAIFSDLHLPENSSRDSLTTPRPRDGTLSQRMALWTPLCCTLHGGNTGLRCGYPKAGSRLVLLAIRQLFIIN